MLASALNLMFPPQCLVCDTIIESHGTLCGGCWRGISFISEPCCAACGLPFDYKLGEEAMCGECVQGLPPYTQARAVFRYDEVSKALILKLKYHDKTALARVYGPWLSKAAAEFADKCDALVPVPLHPWRLMRRKYNQAALLAQAAARTLPLPVWPDALIRLRNTSPQAGQNFKERHKNMEKAFAVHPKWHASVQGKNILLVDDVMTTGATLAQCSKTLLSAGANRVYVLTLARRV